MTTATITAPVDPDLRARMTLVQLEQDGILNIADEPICPECFACPTEQAHFIGCTRSGYDRREPTSWPGLDPSYYGFWVTRDLHHLMDGSAELQWFLYSPGDPYGYMSRHDDEETCWVDAARIASGHLLEVFGIMARQPVEWGW